MVDVDGAHQSFLLDAQMDESGGICSTRKAYDQLAGRQIEPLGNSCNQLRQATRVNQ